MLMSGEANGGELLVPPEAPGSAQGRDWQSQADGARGLAYRGCASTRAVHPSNTIK